MFLVLVTEKIITFLIKIKMERKIGEIFDYDGKSYQVIYGRGCRNCDIKDLSNYNSIKTVAGYCSRDCRKENNEVVFKEINNMENKEKKGTIAEMYACANDELKKVLEEKFSKEELCIKKELPNSWEEFVEQNKIKNNESYITGLSDICNVDKDRVRLPSEDRNILPNKETAEAFLALMQLIQLRDCYRDGWKPDWSEGSVKYSIVNYNGKIDMKENISNSRLLSFPTPNLRNKFFSNFRDLIKTAIELI